MQSLGGGDRKLKLDEIGDAKPMEGFRAKDDIIKETAEADDLLYTRSPIKQTSPIFMQNAYTREPDRIV